MLYKARTELLTTYNRCEVHGYRAHVLPHGPSLHTDLGDCTRPADGLTHYTHWTDLGGRPPRHVHITQNHSVYVNVSSYHWPTGGACWEVTVAAGECGSPPPLEAPRWAHRKCLDRGFVRGPPRLAWLQRRAIRRRAGYQTRLGRLRVARPGWPRRRRRKKVLKSRNI